MEAFLAAARVQVAPITGREAETALDASARYGKDFRNGNVFRFMVLVLMRVS